MNTERVWIKTKVLRYAPDEFIEKWLLADKKHGVRLTQYGDIEATTYYEPLYGNIRMEHEVLYQIND